MSRSKEEFKRFMPKHSIHKVDAQDQPFFCRRCHVCGQVSLAESEISKCQTCHKSFLPFYYFDKKKVQDYADNELRPDDRITKEDFGPIRGLTAYW